MPLISAIGRKSPAVRFLIGAIYVVLILGAVTMVYPLILMVAGSIRGNFDAHEIEMVPRYLTDETAFFRRYVESKYGSSLGSINQSWGTDFLDWQQIKSPPAASVRQLDDFDEFRRQTVLPFDWQILGHADAPAHNQRAFKQTILRESEGNLVRAGELLDMTLRSWSEVVPTQYGLARLMMTPNKLAERTDQFKATRPVEDRILFDLEAFWKTSTLFPRYEGGLETYRAKTGSTATDWSEVHLSQTPPAISNAVARTNWETYVREHVPLSCLRISEAAAPAFREYLQNTYATNLTLLNKSHTTSYQSFEEIPLAATQTFSGSGFIDFNRFVREIIPLEMLSLDGPTFRYRNFLRQKFENIADASEAYQVTWKSFEEASMPTAAMDWRDFQNQKSSLRWEFVIRNYDYVLDFLARHGRGFQNTFILIVLFLVTQLTINPLAAYALSRFGLPSTYKILLFCMATVAFPGEVMMIPSFLQLKEFSLLNTFWALVLPGVANGFSIFLLKGFFDSLPKELYESATMDGASEWTVFWNITMSLSKPILAVMALGSFTSAFGTFFYALIICPDQKMWTLMVWLYQLQATSNSQSINYAALCLASIPTLLVFIFCQRIILRGIVVPSEK